MGEMLSLTLSLWVTWSRELLADLHDLLSCLSFLTRSYIVMKARSCIVSGEGNI